VINDGYDVPQFSANLLSIPQITQIGKKCDFFPNMFVVKDIKYNFVVVIVDTLDPKEILYEFCGFRDPER
jgi:hypothetical protein